MSIFSGIKNYWWGGDPDVKNEISGMSLKDIQNVQKSWESIYANASSNGLLIFVRIFRIMPETQKFFKLIENANEEELATSVVFKAHAINLMSFLNNAVAHLKSPEIVVVMMEKLGHSHNAREIRQKHFWVFRDAMQQILKNDLKQSDNVVDSWELFIEFIIKNIFTNIPN